MAIEIVDLPSYKMVDLSIAMLVHQRVPFLCKLACHNLPIFQDKNQSWKLEHVSVEKA